MTIYNGDRSTGNGSSLGLLPCDRGMQGGGRGLHHFQAAPHGPVVCIYCGKAAAAEPIRVTYGNGANA